MPFCPNCGRQLDEATNSCPICIATAQPEQTQPQQAPPPQFQPPQFQPQQAQPYPPAYPPPPLPYAGYPTPLPLKKKNKKLLWLLLIPVAVIAVIVILVARSDNAYAFKLGIDAGISMAKTAKQTYETYCFSDASEEDTKRIQDVQLKLLQPALDKETVTYRLIAPDGAVVLELPLVCGPEGFATTEELIAARQEAIEKDLLENKSKWKSLVDTHPEAITALTVDTPDKTFQDYGLPPGAMQRCSTYGAIFYTDDATWEFPPVKPGEVYGEFLMYVEEGGTYYLTQNVVIETLFETIIKVAPDTADNAEAWGTVLFEGEEEDPPENYGSYWLLPGLINHMLNNEEASEEDHAEFDPILKELQADLNAALVKAAQEAAQN